MKNPLNKNSIKVGDWVICNNSVDYFCDGDMEKHPSVEDRPPVKVIKVVEDEDYVELYFQFEGTEYSSYNYNANSFIQIKTNKDTFFG